MLIPLGHFQSGVCPAVGHSHRLVDLHGRTAVVTGGAAGIGYFLSERLAALGAHVILAGRNPDRAKAAQRAIQSRLPDATVTFQPLDLADLSSVRAAGQTLLDLPSLDVLVANAGMIGYPKHVKPAGERGVRQQTTLDGHELFWGTNFLGHYALIAMLLPLLLTSGGRCVLVGSLGDRLAPLSADGVPSPDLPASDLAKYGQSKLAISTLMQELARRATGQHFTVLGTHPGTAVDFLSPTREGVAVNQPTTAGPLQAPVRLFTHGKHEGALPLLTAAACPEAGTGDYWGPRWLTRGRPIRTRPNPATRDPDTARHLINAAATLTGVQLPHWTRTLPDAWGPPTRHRADDDGQADQDQRG